VKATEATRGPKGRSDLELQSSIGGAAGVSGDGGEKRGRSLSELGSRHLEEKQKERKLRRRATGRVSRPKSHAESHDEGNLKEGGGSPGHERSFVSHGTTQTPSAKRVGKLGGDDEKFSKKDQLN